MEPQVSYSSDSHVEQSSAAVRQAYAAAPPAPTVTSGQHSSMPQSNPGAAPTITTPTVPAAPPADESAIEQEWVEKAKQVVAQTKDDPFMQQKLVAQLKAQYLATRYGRNVGTSQVK